MQLNFFANHKCGSAWFYKLLSEFAAINNLSFVSTNRGWKVYSKDELPKRSLVFYRNSQYSAINDEVTSGVRIIRNPLSIVTSAYFSHLNSHRIDDWWQLKIQRNILLSVPKPMGMALTIAFLEKSDFYFNSAGPLNALSNWNYDDKRFTTFKMEDFTKNINYFLRKSVAGLGYDPESFKYIDESVFSFESISGRASGVVDTKSHYRSGKDDDWKEHLEPAMISYVVGHLSRFMERFYPSELACCNDLDSLPELMGENNA